MRLPRFTIALLLCLGAAGLWAPRRHPEPHADKASPSAEAHRPGEAVAGRIPIPNPFGATFPAIEVQDVPYSG